MLRLVWKFITLVSMAFCLTSLFPASTQGPVIAWRSLFFPAHVLSIASVLSLGLYFCIAKKSLSGFWIGLVLIPTHESILFAFNTALSVNLVSILDPVSASVYLSLLVLGLWFSNHREKVAVGITSLIILGWLEFVQILWLGGMFHDPLVFKEYAFNMFDNGIVILGWTIPALSMAVFADARSQRKRNSIEIVST